MEHIYRCRKCGYRWIVEGPDPGARIPGEQHRPVCGGCPQCGHLYVEWVNYERVAERCRRGHG